MARYRKKGSFVYVKNKEVLKRSFRSFLPCQVFMVSEHKMSSDRPYVWVESNSMGLSPSECVTATANQIKQYKKEKRIGICLSEENKYEPVLTKKYGMAYTLYMNQVKRQLEEAKSQITRIPEMEIRSKMSYNQWCKRHNKK